LGRIAHPGTQRHKQDGARRVFRRAAVWHFPCRRHRRSNFGNSFVTTGTINPGVIWVGSYFQAGLEAVIPVNAASGTGVGFLGQLDLQLDDIFPKTFGQPLIGGTSAPPRKLIF
jgi:hypothetical protein